MRFQFPVASLSYEFCEVELEDVGVVDGDARIVAEFEAELFGEGRVELDAVKMRGACGEDRGDGAVAGADLDDGARGDVAECVGDAVAGGFVDEEVLAELGFLWGIVVRKMSAVVEFDAPSGSFDFALRASLRMTDFWECCSTCVSSSNRVARRGG